MIRPYVFHSDSLLRVEKVRISHQWVETTDVALTDVRRNLFLLPSSFFSFTWWFATCPRSCKNRADMAPWISNLERL